MDRDHRQYVAENENPLGEKEAPGGLMGRARGKTSAYAGYAPGGREKVREHNMNVAENENPLGEKEEPGGLMGRARGNPSAYAG